jgi:hypothetical protein
MNTPSPWVPSPETLAKLVTAQSHPRWEDRKRVRENVLRVLSATFPRVKFSALWTKSYRYGDSLKIKWPNHVKHPTVEEVRSAIACFETNTGLLVRPPVSPNEAGLDAIAFQQQFGSMSPARLARKPMTPAEQEAWLDQELPAAPAIRRPRF